MANLYLFLFKYFLWLKVFFSLKKKNHLFLPLSLAFSISCWKGKVGGRKSSLRDFSAQVRDQSSVPTLQQLKKTNHFYLWKLLKSTSKLGSVKSSRLLKAELGISGFNLYLNLPSNSVSMANLRACCKCLLPLVPVSHLERAPSLSVEALPSHS